MGTVGKQLGLLKTVLIRAKRDDYPVSSNYQFIDSFGLDKQKRILQTLDLEEIELIKKAPFTLTSFKLLEMDAYRSLYRSKGS